MFDGIHHRCFPPGLILGGLSYVRTESAVKFSWFYGGLAFDLQKFREYLEGSNLITKLQAKHDLLKRALGDGTVCFSVVV